MIDLGKPLVFGDPEYTEFFKKKNEEARELEILKNDKEARNEKIKELEQEIECYEDSIVDSKYRIKELEKEISKIQKMG